MTRVVSRIVLLGVLCSTVRAGVGQVQMGASFRSFKTDTELSVQGGATSTMSLPWRPQLQWSSTGRMSRVGALGRDKRDAGLQGVLSLSPQPSWSLELSTRGWRRSDRATTLIERATGAAAECSARYRGPFGLFFGQKIAGVRERVASLGLGGREYDNGGTQGETEVSLIRTVSGRTATFRFRRSVRDLRLDGTDERTVGLQAEGLPGTARLETFSNERRYWSGSVEERRDEEGTSVQFAGTGAMGTSWEYRGSASRNTYQRGTNQDFTMATHDLRFQLHPRGLSVVDPTLKLDLRYKRYDEARRTIYDREDVGRAIEAGCGIARGDSVLWGRVSHVVSLDRTVYLDAANTSDRDTRDQRIGVDLGWRPGEATFTVGLGRRRNDLVYIDAERSANTVRNTEYVASLGYRVVRRAVRWSQAVTLSARSASFRFKPSANTLSRRGLVESRLTLVSAPYEVAADARWLWDDSGPFRHGTFRRMELTEDIDAGIVVWASWERWRLGPGIRYRWRWVYGPEGRHGPTTSPPHAERRGTLTVEVPLWSRAVVVSATRVTRGRSSHWEASAEVRGGT